MLNGDTKAWLIIDFHIPHAEAEDYKQYIFTKTFLNI